MIKTISRTQDTILVVDDLTVKTARADHPKWAEIQRTFNQINFENDRFVGPTDELLALMDLRTAVETYSVGLLSVNALGVTYAGRPLHTVDAERVIAFMRDGLSYKPIANYIVRKMKNPSSRAIQEMYNFLEHKGMSLTAKGTFIAYKGVSPDFWSICGNKDTVVIQGYTDSEGKIQNSIGSTIEVERSSVDDDFRKGCSHGLHAGSLAYAKGWGARVILVEIDPADVVSVPEDCNCQKLRCSKYVVLAEYSGPMPDTLTTEFDDEDVCHQCGAPEGDCNCEQDADAKKTIPTDSQGRTEENMVSGDDCPVCKYDKFACVCNRPFTTAGCPCGDVEDHVSCSDHSEMADAGYPKGDETPDESWIREKAAIENQSIVTAGGGLILNPKKETARQVLGFSEYDGLKSNDTYKRVVRVISEQVDVPSHQIEPSTRMDSSLLGLDSLDGVEVTMAIEEEFSIEIPDEDVEKSEGVMVSEIVKYIENRIERERARTITPPPVDPNYAQGKIDGQLDAEREWQPKWLKGDESGADSYMHAQYVLGYVAGYGQ